MLVQTTFTHGTTKQADIKLSGLAAAQKNRVPPRLSTTLRGTIEWVEVHSKTGAGANVDVLWFGNDRYLAASTPTSVEFLGKQGFTGTDFDTSSTNFAILDAQGLGLNYRDADDSGEFHVRIESAAANSATGVVTFAFRPEFQVGRGQA